MRFVWVSLSTVVVAILAADFQVLDFAKMGDAKSSWPELLRATSAAAKQKILRDRPDVRVIVLPVGSFVTADYNPKRVRVFINSSGYVAKVPTIG
jgi:hypothetical protein